jgi:hypothetical protein
MTDLEMFPLRALRLCERPSCAESRLADLRQADESLHQFSGALENRSANGVLRHGVHRRPAEVHGPKPPFHRHIAEQGVPQFRSFRLTRLTEQGSE